MSGYSKPSHTQVPNLLLDKHMADMGEAELKVVLAVTRKTIGWHKTRDRLSFSQLMDLTGLSRQGVSDGTAAAVERGVIERYPVGNSFEYELVVSEADQPETVNEIDRPSQPSRPILPKNGQPSRHTKETLKQTSQNKDSGFAAPPEPEYVDDWEGQFSGQTRISRKPKTPKPILDGMSRALGEVMGWDMRISSNYGKLGKLSGDLIRAGYSEEVVRKTFGPGGAWYQYHWLGKKGDKPNPKWVAEEIGTLSGKVGSAPAIKYNAEEAKRKALEAMGAG